MMNSNLEVNSALIFSKQYLSNITDTEVKSKAKLDDFNSLIEHIKSKHQNSYSLNGVDWLVNALKAKSSNIDELENGTELHALKKLSLNTNNYCITGHQNWPRGFQKGAIAIGYIMDNGANAFKSNNYLDTDGIKAWLTWNKSELIKKTGDDNIVQEIMNELNDKYFKNVHLNANGEVIFAEKSQYSECSIKLDSLSPIQKRDEKASLEKFLTTYSSSDELPNLIDWITNGFTKEELNRSPTTLLNKIMSFYFCQNPVQRFNYDTFLAWLDGFQQAAAQHILKHDMSMDIDLRDMVSELNQFSQANKNFVNTLGKSLQHKDYGDVRSQIAWHNKREKLKAELDNKLPILVPGKFLRLISNECIREASLLITKASSKAINPSNFNGNKTEKSFLKALQSVYQTFEKKEVSYDYTYLTDKYFKCLDTKEDQSRLKAINTHKKQLLQVITQHLDDINADIRVSLNVTNNDILNSQVNNSSKFQAQIGKEVKRNYLLEEAEPYPFEVNQDLHKTNEEVNLSKRGIIKFDESIDRIHSLRRKTTFREHRESFIKERKIAGGAKKCLIKLDSGKFYVIVSDIRKVDDEYRNEQKMQLHIERYPVLKPYCSTQERIGHTEFARISSMDDPTYAKYLRSDEFNNLESNTKKAVVLDMIKSYHMAIFKFLENEATHGDYHLENGKRNINDLDKKDRAFDFGLCKVGEEVKSDPLFDFRYAWINGTRWRKFQNTISTLFNAKKLEKHYPIIQMLKAGDASAGQVESVENLMKNAYIVAKNLLAEYDYDNTDKGFHAKMKENIEILEVQIAEVFFT